MQLTDLQMKISKTINESNLPIDAIYFVFKDIMNEIVDIYNKSLENEKIAEMNKKNENIIEEQKEKGKDEEERDNEE